MQKVKVQNRFLIPGAQRLFRERSILKFNRHTSKPTNGLPREKSLFRERSILKLNRHTSKATNGLPREKSLFRERSMLKFNRHIMTHGNINSDNAHQY